MYKAVRASNGKALRTSDGLDLRTDASDTCPSYELLSCVDGTSSGLGLSDSNNTDNATTGDTILNSDDGLCYTLGCRKCGLTLTAGAASKKTGCDDPDCSAPIDSAPCEDCFGTANVTLNATWTTVPFDCALAANAAARNLNFTGAMVYGTCYSTPPFGPTIWGVGPIGSTPATVTVSTGGPYTVAGRFCLSCGGTDQWYVTARLEYGSSFQCLGPPPIGTDTGIDLSFPISITCDGFGQPSGSATVHFLNNHGVSETLTIAFT